jgi:RNA polymerase sigma-70 factor (ECF subfamily)
MTSDLYREPENKQGENETKLAGLYDEYFNKIAHYAYVRIGDRTEAEDLASEVFLKALESLKTYQERGIPIQAWLFKIAHNLVVDHLRRASKRNYLPLEKVELTSDTDPEGNAMINLELERVKKAMQNLTEEQKEVLNLRFFAGLSSKETARLLNKNDGAVREMQSAA